MRLEKVTSDTANKLFRATKLQITLNEFARMDDAVVKCVLEPGEYSSIRSAQSSYCTAIRRSGHRMAARILNGELYLIKLSTKDL